MPLIGYAIGNIDEHFIISDVYKPQNFEAGWYFIPNNFPSYTFISADIDPTVDEVVKDGDKFIIQGFDPYLESMDFPENYKPKKTEYVKDNYYHFPSGVPFDYQMGYYWEMYGDLDSPYLFIPYFDHSTYGSIAWLDFNTPIERFNAQLTLVEHLLKGIVFPFVEKVVVDKTLEFPLIEKIVSLLSCDIEMVSPTSMILKWSGERVPYIEILRKEISDSSFGEPIAQVAFGDLSYPIEIDNNSFTYSVRGSNGTGQSNVEVTIGVKGKTTIETEINLGDFVKIYEGNIGFVDIFETEISI
jgi:hypothetical protein